MTQTPLALARKAAEVLAGRGVEQSRLEAELLLSAVLGTGRLEMYLQHERPLTPAEVAAYREVVRRRLRGEPLQYITGRISFRELTLEVDTRVLIPRPETEVLVGEVLAWAAHRMTRPAERAGIGSGSSVSAAASRGLTALDVGTGSGAIALSLVAEGPFERVVATDVSAAALAVAQSNAHRLGLEARLEFREASLWDAVRPAERFDVIVSNPPYVAESERAELPPEVREWEPPVALFAGGDGLAVELALVAGAPARLAPGGLLAVEVGYGQASAVAAAIAANPVYAAPRVVRDLTGRERVVLAVVKPLANGGGEGNNG